jgi:hypothetical protein
MNNSKAGSVCPRCGKDRVVIRTYREKVGTTYVEYTETACPDPNCQSKVNTQLASDASKRLTIKNEQNKREQERKTRIAENRASRE